MQVSVEASAGLERRMTVQVPEQEIRDRVEERLKSLAKEVRLDGFRPGKVPVRVVRQRFGGRVRQEVLGEVVQSSFEQAVTQENLRPAGGPRIDPVQESLGDNFGYTAVFEVYPEVKLASLDGLVITKPVAEISAEDVEQTIEKLRKQKATWRLVERPAARSERVEINFKGTIDGGPFEGGEAEKMPLTLGSGSMIPGFEEGLEGVAAGESVVLELEFPADYRVAKLAGKAVKFEVEVLSVAEQVLPDIDEALVRGFGVESGDLDEFRREVRDNMQREMDQAIRSRVKQQVMDQLLERNPLDVPKALVDDEITRLIQQVAPQTKTPGARQDMNLPRSLFEDQAKRRVALGLLLAELVEANKIKVDKDRVRQTIQQFAATYDDPQAVVSWYHSNPEQMASVESVVLEDQIVDWVVGRVTVEEERTDFETLANTRQTTGS